LKKLDNDLFSLVNTTTTTNNITLNINNTFDNLTNTNELISKKRLRTRTPSCSSQANNSIINNTTDVQTLKRNNKKLILKDLADGISMNLDKKIFSKKKNDLKLK